MLPDPGPNLVNVACSWEKIAIVLVEGDRHDSVGGIKRLLNAIPVVDINVDIEDPRVMARREQCGQ